jgi:hypothetical protein
MAINLGDALLKLSVDSTELEKGLKNVQTTCTNLGKKMMLLGTAIAGGLIGATIASAKLGEEISNMAKRTGLSMVALSELRYMADLSGTSLEGLEAGIRRMQSVIADAANGMPAATEALGRLGLSIADLMALSPEEQFYTLALAVANMGDETLRAAMAQEIFGRTGTDLLPLFAEGAEGIAKMRQEAHEYGRIIDEEAATKSKTFMDALTKLKESFGGIVDAIGIALMPILTNLIENKILPIITHITDWVTAHKDLVITFGKIALAIVGAGGVLLALGALSRAIIAINAALIILQSLAGPAGWAKLAIGIGIAAAAIVGMNKLIGSVETPETEVPGMQYGGIVPGPKGRPVPIIAHGGEEFLGVQGLAGGAAARTVNMNVGLLPGDDVTMKRLVRVIKDMLGEDARRTSFGQVNRGYFFGRSSI